MIDKTRIAAQAKKIMDTFVAELEKAEKIEPDFKVRREQNIRATNVKAETQSDFRERMFRNAPNASADHILAEKKKW